MVLGHIRTYLLTGLVVCHHLDHSVDQTHFHLHLPIVALSVELGNKSTGLRYDSSCSVRLSVGLSL